MIDAVDYGKELSRLRTRYDKLAKEKDRVQTDELESVRLLADKNHQKQISRFEEQKNNIENEYADKIEAAKQKNQQRIDETRTNYHEMLSDVRDEFEDRRKESLDQYNNKLENVSDTFNRSLSIKQAEKDSALRGMKNNYARYSQNLKDVQRDETDKIQKRSQEFRDAMLKDKAATIQGLKTDQEDLIQKMIEKDNLRYRDMVEKKDKQTDDVVRSFKNETLNRDDKEEKILTNIKRKNESTLRKLQDDYTYLIDMQRERNFEDLNKERLSSKERAFAQDQAYEVERRNLGEKINNIKDVKLADSDELLRNSEKEKRGIKKRLDKFEEKSAQLGKDYYEKNAKVASDYMGDVNKVRKELDKKSEQSENALRNSFLERIDQIKNDKNDQLKTYLERSRLTEEDLNKQLDLEIKKSKKKAERDNINFNKEMGRVVEKNSNEAWKTREETCQKIKNIYIETQNDKSKTIGELRQEYANKLDDLQESYLQRMNKKQTELNDLEEKHTEALNDTLKNNAKNAQYRDLLFQAQYDDQVKFLRDAMKDKDREVTKQMDKMKEGYEKKIETLQKEYGKKIKNILSDFKSTVDLMNLEKIQEIKKAEKLSMAEQKRLNAEHEETLNRTEERYATKIEQIRNAYEGKIEKLEDRMHESQKVISHMNESK